MLSGNIRALNIPVYVVEDGDKADDIKDPMCYLVTKNGVMLKKTNHLYSATSKVSEISGLAEVKESAKLSFVKMKPEMLRRVVEFFRDVYEDRKSEAVVLLHFSREANAWAVMVPFQDVSGGSAKYTSDRQMFMDDCGNVVDSLPQGFRPMGSIHSHASMSAFHSGTDDRDEYGFDGLHITVGRLDSKKVEFAVRWIAAGQAIKSEISEVVEGKTETKVASPFMAMLKPKTETSWRYDGRSGGYGPSGQDFDYSGYDGFKDSSRTPMYGREKMFPGRFNDDSTDMGSRGPAVEPAHPEEMVDCSESGIVMHKF